VLRLEQGLATALLAVLVAAGPAGAGEAVDKGSGPASANRKLEDVERAIQQDKARALELQRKSAAIASELDSLRQQMIAAARATQEEEQQLSALESRLEELRRAEEEKGRELQARRAQLAETLAALERLALYPPEAMAALPESPVDTVRSALLLRAVVPEVEARAERLRGDLAALDSLRSRIAEQHETIAAAKEKLDADHARLVALLERKAVLYRETEADRARAEDRVARLGSEAKDLRELIEKLEAERAEREALARAQPAPPPASVAPPAASPAAPAPGAEVAALPPSQPTTIRPIGEAQGQLTLPARGEIVQEFGQSGDYGAASKGLTIRTRGGAEVVAPYDGQVVFAGPFRGYGPILIIEHTEGYHTLLAGLSRIDAAPGQWVLGGEPVGVMGDQRDGDGPELYVELRRNGRPINPLPWLALHNGKVSG
jgi:murein hydrolase activator